MRAEHHAGRTGAGLSGTSATNIPSQWQFSNTASLTKLGAAGVSTNANGFVDLSGGLFAGANADCVIELLLEGTTVPTAGNLQFSTSEFNAKQAAPVIAPLNRGSHLYLTLRRQRFGLAGTLPSASTSNTSVAILTRNLADAVAALTAASEDFAVTGNFNYSNALYPSQLLAAATVLNISGFYRQLTLKAADDFQV